MKNNQIDIKYREEYVGIRTFKLKFIAEITHAGLNDFNVFFSYDQGILQNKVKNHVAKLEEKWNKFLDKQNTVATIKVAEERTKEALNALKQVENILLCALNIDNKIDWELLKDKHIFDVPSPEKQLEQRLRNIVKPSRTAFQTHTEIPNQLNFKPKFSLWDYLVPSKKEQKIQFANELYKKALNEWNEKCEIIDNSNIKITEDYQRSVLKYEKQREKIKLAVLEEILVWEKSKADFLIQKEQNNAEVDKMKLAYLQGEPSAVLEYCELVLNSSQYPESFPKTFEIEYNADNKILIVEYSLPTIEQLPKLNEVKFIKNELKENYISELQIQKLFDSTMYKITLRSIHELFDADIANAIDAISFNGWINGLNKGTGKRENNCILSIQVKKSEFLEIDLNHVDPKICFKSFKGIGSSKLSGITPIQPILQINKTDRRFVNSYDVADSLDDTINLAAMDWEDFEHLIREIFGKEFSSNGGEVKVTQASRDGGVDAIAFDPDPIRGGKIVIQAKRYTNTVGVSAVRDLYGTVMNEGATKGILVTTADYGPDAYEFVKGKPLTLMNGANLLYLLEKHGHRAKIDIKEAKRMMNE